MFIGTLRAIPSVSAESGQWAQVAECLLLIVAARKVVQVQQFDCVWSRGGGDVKVTFGRQKVDSSIWKMTRAGQGRGNAASNSIWYVLEYSSQLLRRHIKTYCFFFSLDCSFLVTIRVVTLKVDYSYTRCHDILFSLDTGLTYKYQALVQSMLIDDGDIDDEWCWGFWFH